MNFLTDWAKNIIYYVLFIKLISNLIPSGNMARYIKLFSGILLIFILIEPLLTLKNMDKIFMNNILNIENELYRENFINQSKTYSNVNNQIAINLYKEKIEEHINKIVSKENMELISSDIKIAQEEGESFGKITEINLQIKKADFNSSRGINIDSIKINSQVKSDDISSSENIIIVKNIKTELFNFYNVPIHNINISIS